MFKKLSLLLAVALMLVTAQPVLAAKPDHAGGKPPKDNPPVERALSVCLDPGHGGSDPGAVYGGIKESELNLSVALKVENLLKQNGFAVELTRTDERSLTNNDRYTFCNATDASTLVSIHHNASTNPDIDYTLGMYHQANSLALTNTISQSIASAMGHDSYRTSRFPSGVLIKSRMPSTMTEGYFLSSSARQAQLQSETGRQGLEHSEAAAIVQGLLQYYAD